MTGGVETIPAGPGRWVICARVGDRWSSVAMFGVMLADGGLVWSATVDRATTFLTMRRARDVVTDCRRRGDVWTVAARVSVERDDLARSVERLSRAGALGEQ